MAPVTNTLLNTTLSDDLFDIDTSVCKHNFIVTGQSGARFTTFCTVRYFISVVPNIQ